MAKLRRAIRLLPDEDQLLRHLYTEFKIPSDQYERRPQDLERFVTVWNDLSGRSDAPGEVLHYIITQRKQKEKNWPTFNGKHKRLTAMPDDFLSPGEWAALKTVYRDVVMPLGIGSDNLAYDDQLAAQVAREFFKLTGRSVPGRLLFAALMAKRKRGEWDTLPKKDGRGFGDINAIG